MSAVWALLAFLPLPSALGAAPQTGAMIEVRLGSGLFEGKPLWWSNKEVNLLARDGQLIYFRPSRARDYHQTAPRFSSYSASEMRHRLYAEFGSDVEVTGTGHYLVVHPRGQRKKWARRFEDLYRSFYHYFSVRGFTVRESQFPLVSIVFKSRQDYQQYAARIGAKISPNYLGHYSRTTNRIYLFDATKDESFDWSQNTSTIIHEATHQTAFNTGVHSRFADTPRWVSEGLATMFEAPGVWDAKTSRPRSDRINRERLVEFKVHVQKRPELWMLRLIRSDELFTTLPNRAYAEAWALSFYLCETRPRQYTQYLARTAGRAHFEDYTAKERLADFAAVFGRDVKMLDVQFLRYMARVK